MSAPLQVVKVVVKLALAIASSDDGVGGWCGVAGGGDGDGGGEL